MTSRGCMHGGLAYEILKGTGLPYTLFILSCSTEGDFPSTLAVTRVKEYSPPKCPSLYYICHKRLSFCPTLRRAVLRQAMIISILTPSFVS